MMNKKILRCIAGTMALAMPLTGCGIVKNQTNSEKGAVSASVTQVKEPEKIKYEDYEAKYALREANPVSDELVSAVNQFSCRTAAKILQEGNVNRNYSPLSLYFAMALAAQGSAGETEKEFLNLLGVQDKETLAEECGKLYRRLYTDNEISQIKLANSLWMAQGQNFKEKFLQTAQDDFYSSLFLADFGNAETGKEMGKWISEQTNGTLAPELPVSKETILAILNTVYFYDEWFDSFLESANTEGTFTTASGEEVNCEYMNQTLFLGAFYQGEDYTGTSLSLKNGGSMVFLLPEENRDIQDFLTEEKLNEMFFPENAASGEVVLSLPKFSFNDSMELAEILQELDFAKAFQNNADFSAMTDQGAFISQIKQETHIGINEKGVEASAYTEIALDGAAAIQETYELKFDHPFLFGIVSDLGVPLFLGICGNPAQVD